MSREPKAESRKPENARAISAFDPRPSTLDRFYALAFGLFLGLCIWKFGNPVILDQKISAPETFADFLGDAWPTHWGNWILLPLAACGALLVFQNKISWPRSKWLWLLPLAWLGWQFFSATRTVDADLTTATLWQFCGCVACYFLGALAIGAPNSGSASLNSLRAGRQTGAPALRNGFSFFLIGVLAAFTFCLVRAVDQRLFEFPANYQMLADGERDGWTNFPPATVAEMKSENIIISTNGADVANPMILAKFAKGRVSGTLVYPNALAEIILLLWPASLALAFGATKKLKPLIRLAAIAMTLFLGGAAFFWTGSKLGWLIGMGVAGIYLLRLDWPKKIKFAAVAMVLIFGLGIFAVRFHQYFSAGATSAGARFDYWRAAVQTTAAKPVFGSGPGTFQRPYAQLKSPKSEMARLAHNDFLEQFSDSGVPGGLIYVAWIFLALATVGKRLWRSEDHFSFAIFAGLLGWFAQGFGEFGLYVPALAWTAFTLLGCLIGAK
jgi:hypothetical protein